MRTPTKHDCRWEMWELAQKLQKDCRAYDTLGEANPADWTFCSVLTAGKMTITVPKAYEELPIPLIL